MPPVTNTKSSLKNRVKIGIKYLDKHQPRWLKKINTHRLDMDDVCNCVLGQIFSHYLVGLYSLNLINRKYPKAIQLGFRGRNKKENDKLKSIWIELIIEKKRKENIVPDFFVTSDDDDEDEDPKKKK